LTSSGLLRKFGRARLLGAQRGASPPTFQSWASTLMNIFEHENLDRAAFYSMKLGDVASNGSSQFGTCDHDENTAFTGIFGSRFVSFQYKPLKKSRSRLRSAGKMNG
jgi:hypothetical protein